MRNQKYIYIRPVDAGHRDSELANVQLISSINGGAKLSRYFIRAIISNA